MSVLRYPVLDVNVDPDPGRRRGGVVDTLSTDAQARELSDGVRPSPSCRCVVNTHHHFDHCFGNAVLAAAARQPDLGPRGGRGGAARAGERLQREWYEEWLPTDPTWPRAWPRTGTAPDRTVHTESMMDIGGRTVELRHLGRGHTDGDLVVLSRTPGW